MKKSLLYIASIFVAMLFCVSANAKLTITEIMPCNFSTYIDDQANFSPYLELVSDEEIDLIGATVTLTRLASEDADKKQKEMWSVKLEKNHVVMPSTYSLMLFGYDEEKPNKGTLIAGRIPGKLEFKASTLTITSAAGKLLASITYPDMKPGLSYGSEGYMIPSPGEENTQGFASLSKMCKKPSFSSSSQPGSYPTKKKITVRLDVPEGTTVYYTTNGAEVVKGKSGAKYKDSIVVSNTAAVRARAYKSDMLPSEELVGSFFLRHKQYDDCGGDSLPIVHIITDSLYLYSDPYGISVVGSNGTKGNCSDDKHKDKANYYQDWERPAVFQYFSPKGELLSSQLVEIGVFGGCSRKYDVKSLKIKASKKTGKNRFDYTGFFKEKDFSEVKSLQLRNGGNGYEGLIFRDGFMQSLCKGLDIDYQAYQPVAYYINGEYQRLMGLRERTNADYVYHNYGYEDDEIDHLEIAKEEITPSKGDLDRYNEMIEYVEGHYEDADFYDRLSEYMDVDEYLNWLIFEQYIVNTDWPANNTKIWRRKRDGKFRWILYDTDFGYGIYGGGGPNYTSEYTDMIAFCKGEGSSINWGNGTKIGDYYTADNESKWKTTLFKHCIMNPDFKAQYIARYRKIVSQVFEKERVMAVWDSVAALVKRDFCATNRNVDHYRSGIKSFTENRKGEALKHLRNHFGMTEDKVNLTFDMKCKTEVPGFAFLFNKERKEKTSYTYEALKGQSVKIEPLVPFGYKIDSLVSSVSSANTSVLKILSSSTEWRYYYKDDAPAGDWKSLDYNDNGWAKGKGRIGYSPRETFNTTLDSTGNMTTYFRSKVSFDNGAVPELVSINVTYDDGYVMYVNGKEVSRVNLPDSVAIKYSTPALEYVNEVSEVVEINGSYFKEGENIIAIEVHQEKPESSDLVFAVSGNATVVTSPTQAKNCYEGAVMKDTKVTLYLSEDNNFKSPRLYVNEICSSNNATVDDWGEKPDWIEIYNAEDKPVDLAGLIISKVKDGVKKNEYQFPTGRLNTVIPAHGHTVVWATKDGEDGPLHTGYNLSAKVPYTVSLSQIVRGKETVIDEMTYELHEKNGSYGRTSDGGDELATFYECQSPANHGSIIPTPFEANGVLCEPSDTEDTIVEIKKGIELYPNPASNVIFISLIEAKEAEWNIIDFSGRQVKSGAVVDGKTVAEIGNLPAGVYAVRVQTAEDVFTEIFIKK